MKTQDVRISIIIPTVNSWKTLKDCLFSIERQTLRPTEIIVVDNASMDNTSSLLKRYFPKITVISLKKNNGVSGGRNSGIDIASKKSDYLLFVDHDMTLEKNCLKNLILVGEGNQEYGILTPKIFYYSDRKRVWAAGTNINLWTGQVLFRGGKDVGQFEKIEEVQVAPAIILVKRKIIEILKGFNKKYFATYEDTDFCFRAKKFDFKTIYVPKAIAYHQIETTKKSERERLLDRSFLVSKNRIIFMKDFGRIFPLFLLLSPIYLLYFIYMSIMEKNFKALTGFVEGYISGIQEVIKL